VTIKSISPDERETAISKELENIGISVAAFEANKRFIMDWFQTVIATGAFEEQDTLQDSDGAASNVDHSSIDDIIPGTSEEQNP
jgi:hypothetical protein